MAVTALVGAGLLVMSSVLPAESAGDRVSFGLGTGLLAAAMFTSAQALITATASNRVLVDALAQHTRAAMRDLVDEYRRQEPAYLPTHTFEGTSEPDPELNQLLTRDLEASRVHLFRGMSARHTAARLLGAPLRRWETHSAVDWEVQVVVADLQDERSLRERARYLMIESIHEYSLTDKCDEIKRRVCSGLVGLYLARLRCSKIEVTVSRSPFLDRLEIFDASIWLTPSDGESSDKIYPPTYRFGRDSLTYAVQLRDFQRFVYDGRTEVILPATSDDEFLRLFTRLTGTSLGLADMAKLTEEFHSFRRGFLLDAKISRA